ncbi:MAG: hypothetical protein A3H94_01425 [Acidobacteria bacterium RIFCSPLOWO2_02_FULL_60_20]|nr:MAG: hypothetical protein A3H94_01425 [Acidobacteria bacterium RIFCSPLOWO2_02_FULL_60_20]
MKRPPAETPFRVLDANDPAEFAEWLEIWQAWPQQEVVAHPVYVQLFADRCSHPKCAIWQSDNCGALYPFLLRDLSSEPFCEPNFGPIADIVSPYGYGGAFVWGTENAATLAAIFWKAFDQWARSNHVVSEFIRFSLFPENLLPYPGEKLLLSHNVVRSLEPAEDEIWMDFRQKVRKNVKRAHHHGMQVQVDTTGARLEDFLALYNGTMVRRNAEQFYYFPKLFFQRLSCGLAGHFAYFHCLLGGEVISTELVLLSRSNVYSFLGGTDERYFEMRPNDLIKYEISLWAKRSGKKRFVLGGGYKLNDGIYRYKLSFAPSGETPFFAGRRILDPVMYERLVCSRAESVRRKTGQKWTARCDFFPEYRA